MRKPTLSIDRILLDAEIVYWQRQRWVILFFGVLVGIVVYHGGWFIYQRTLPTHAACYHLDSYIAARQQLGDNAVPVITPSNKKSLTDLRTTAGCHDDKN